MLGAVGGGIYVPSLGMKPSKWSAPVMWLGVVSIVAIKRANGIVQAHFTLEQA